MLTTTRLANKYTYIHTVKLHKWGIRTALNSKYNAHTELLYKQHNILNLNDLYELKCMLLIRAKIDNETPEKNQSMFYFI